MIHAEKASMKILRPGALASLLLLWGSLVVPAAERGPDLRAGVLYGVITDAESGKPLSGVTVAALDSKGHPIAWGKTDDSGRYALPAAPLKALNLEKEGRGGGLLAGLVRGTGKLIGTAVDVTVDATKVVAGAVVGQQTLGAAAAVVNPGTGSGPTAQAKAQIAQESAGKASQRVKGELDLEEKPHAKRPEAKKTEKPVTAGPGQVILKAALSNYQEFQGPASVYWMEPPVAEKGQPQIGPQAWLEPVKLAASGKEGKSCVCPTRIVIEDARLEPDLATPGSTVKVSARVNAPKQEGLAYRVFLVDDRAHAVVELKPGDGGRYLADWTVPEKHPLGDTVLVLAALRTRPVTVDVSRAQEDPLPRLAARLDDLKPSHKYEYDPRICASHNRVELRFIVLDPKKGVLDPSAVPVDRKPAPSQADVKK